uniref:Riboflavin transporter n=1 Tax=Periophthalmus magnuspinnatus TaxID=409849 RepID=A0A3B4AVW9_9GOBI
MAVLVHLLACAFGLGSWVAVNGLWVELPLIVNALPEGWDLPSYLTVIIQLANLGPLLVTLMHRLCPGRLKEHLVIYVILSIGIVSCLLLALFWDRTTLIGGAPHSTAFFIITFFLALVDCTTEELWIFKTEYLPPNFSTELFFFFLALMMCISLAAFVALNKLPRTFEMSTENLVPDTAVSSICSGLDNPGADTEGEGSHADEAESPLKAHPKHSMAQLCFIYCVVVWVNAATNGLLPSVQTYSCMPYGNLAYHLSAALSSVANPLACTVAMFVQNRSLAFMGVLTLMGTGFGSYNMAMAAMSPCPLFQSAMLGEILIVLSWLCFTGTLSYVKVMVGVILRDRSHSALVWCGAAAQMGSLLGSVTMFPLVNVYRLFQTSDFCNSQCPS